MNRKIHLGRAMVTIVLFAIVFLVFSHFDPKVNYGQVLVTMWIGLVIFLSVFFVAGEKIDD